MKGQRPPKGSTAPSHKLDLPQQATLSTGEHRVFQSPSQGMAPKEIAYELSLSQKTVYAHCKSIMQQLRLHDLHALMLFAAGNRQQSMDNSHHEKKKQ